jgi:hypothetical protein
MVTPFALTAYHTLCPMCCRFHPWIGSDHSKSSHEHAGCIAALEDALLRDRLLCIRERPPVPKNWPVTSDFWDIKGEALGL